MTFRQKCLTVSLLTVLVAGAAPAHTLAQAGSETDPWALHFRSLSEDIHIAFRPEPLRFIVEGNVTIIINETDVVVVDGSGAPRAALQVIDFIRSHTPNPVSVLVNTHGHGDHTLGNQEYALAFPGVEIVSRPAHRRTARPIAGQS